MSFKLTALHIELTDEEILDDLLYPGASEGGVR